MKTEIFSEEQYQHPANQNRDNAIIGFRSVEKQVIELSRIKIKKRNLRYRLHSNVRKQGFNLITKDRIIYLPYGNTFPESKYVQRLVKEFGYVIQFYLESQQGKEKP